MGRKGSAEEAHGLWCLATNLDPLLQLTPLLQFTGRPIPIGRSFAPWNFGAAGPLV